MQKVLCLYEYDMPTVRSLRCFFEGLDKQYKTTTSFVRTYEVSSRLLNEANIYFFIRPTEFLTSILIKRAKTAGKIVVEFFDDNLMALPSDFIVSPWYKSHIKKIVPMADIIGSSSQHINSQYSKLTKSGRFLRIDSSFSPEELSLIPIYTESNNSIKVVYAAGGGHISEFEKYIAPVIPKLGERYGRSVQYFFVGMDINPTKFLDIIDMSVIPPMPFEEYRQYMRDNHFDLGLAPLDTNDFTKCKYFNKFIEYSIVGIPGVYSNVEPYTDIVINGMNGLLSDNTNDEWFNSICKMIDDSKLRLVCAENSRKILNTKFTRDAQLNIFIKGLPELFYDEINTKCVSKPIIATILSKLEKNIELIFKSFVILKTKGVRKLALQFKSHLRAKKIYR